MLSAFREWGRWCAPILAPTFAYGLIDDGSIRQAAEEKSLDQFAALQTGASRPWNGWVI